MCTITFITRSSKFLPIIPGHSLDQRQKSILISFTKEKLGCHELHLNRMTVCIPLSAFFVTAKCFEAYFYTVF